MAEELIYSDGNVELRGLVERSSSPNGRALLLLHEIDGVGPNVRRRAKMLAELGYHCLAADLYGDHADSRIAEDAEAFRRRIGAGLDELFKLTGLPPEKVAAIGYCFGGKAALELARSGRELAAVISFHGLFDTPRPARPGEVRSRILACTGARDPLVPLDHVDAFQREMDLAEADWQLIVYGRAKHAFTNPYADGKKDERLAHDPSADRQSWQAALLFLDEALG